MVQSSRIDHMMHSLQDIGCVGRVMIRILMLNKVLKSFKNYDGKHYNLYENHYILEQ